MNKNILTIIITIIIMIKLIKMNYNNYNHCNDNDNYNKNDDENHNTGNSWMDNLQFYILFKQYFSHFRTRKGDNDRLSVIEPHLRIE